MKTIGVIVGVENGIMTTKVTRGEEVKTLQTASTFRNVTLADRENMLRKTENTTLQVTINNTPALIMTQRTTITAHIISSSNITKPFVVQTRKHTTNGTRSILR